MGRVPRRPEVGMVIRMRGLPGTLEGPLASSYLKESASRLLVRTGSQALPRCRTPRRSQSETKRKRAKAKVVIPQPKSMIGSGSTRGKTIGTATTTLPSRARSNVTSR